MNSARPPRFRLLHVLLAAVAVCGLLSLAAGCRGDGPGAGHPVEAGNRQAQAGFSLELLEDAVIGSAGLDLEVDAQGETAEVTVSVRDASALRAVYFRLGYDTEKFAPLAARSTGLMSSGEPPLALTVESAPGVIEHGQVQAGWNSRRGFSGAGVIARFSFGSPAAGQAASGVIESPGRRAAAAPVSDAAAHYLNFNPEANVFLWYYVNPGDYDQNGEVGITDLTPLGANFNDEGPFGVSDARIVVDGDGNGVINIADITTIGQNFGNSIDSFSVYGSSDSGDYPASNSAASGPGARVVGSRPFSAAHGGGTQRKYWDLEIKTPVIGDGRYWLRPLAGGSPGTPSQLVSHSQQWHVTEVVSYDGDPQNSASICVAEVNGTPSIVLIAFRNDLIMEQFEKFIYCDAADKLGLSWNTPYQISESSAGSQSLPRLAEVNGAPAYMWYSDSGSFPIRYQRALNAAGTNWDVPVTVDYVSYPQNTALLVCNGKPVAIYNAGNQLQASLALDAEGGTWLPAVTLHGQISNWWGRMGAAELPGGFGVAFDDNLSGALNYMYVGVDGTSATPGAPVEVFPGNVGQNLYVRFGLADGRPYALTKRANSKFYFSYAADALGEDWIAPDVSGLTGQVHRIGSTGAYGLAWAMYFDDETGYVRAGYGPADKSGPWVEVEPVVQYSASQSQVTDLQGITVGGHPAVAIDQGSQNKVYFAVYY